jgi:hypothetical protein
MASIIIFIMILGMALVVPVPCSGVLVAFLVLQKKRPKPWVSGEIKRYVALCKFLNLNELFTVSDAFEQTKL